MVCVLATLKVKEEKISEFEKIFIELSDQVRSNEEGNIFYQIARDREQENTYVVLESAGFADPLCFQTLLDINHISFHSLILKRI